MGTPFWLAFASLLVSVIIGGSGLAVAILGNRSNRQAIRDAWVREWAAQRPVVYPLVLDDWLTGRTGTPYADWRQLHVLPLKNGGRGPALNVRGVLTLAPGRGGGERQLLGTTIAAGDLLNVQVVPPIDTPPVAALADAHGTISYRDLAGGIWDQGFAFTQDSNGGLDLQLSEPSQRQEARSAAVAD